MVGNDDSIAAALEGWDGEQVVCRHDKSSGSWMFVAMHSTVRGPAGGGTRLRTYGKPVEGLADAMQLARAMTLKAAMADLPIGGGKAVLAVPSIPSGTERDELLLRHVGMVESLGGSFVTGPDMNISVADLDLMRQHSNRIFGTTSGAQDGRTIADATALGTLHGIRACLKHVYGSDGLCGRTVLVQGLGGVGRPLAELLAKEGARLVVTDLDERRVAAAVERFGAEPVPPDDVLGTSCDVFAPAAIGGVLGSEDADMLGARILAGCANNPFRDAEAPEALRAAGVLYAPDFVINSGGAIHAIGSEALGWSAEQVLDRIAGIGPTLEEVLRLAEAEGVSTEAAANRIAAERLHGAAQSTSTIEATAA
jgi:leucine dehydrogenase